MKDDLWWNIPDGNLIPLCRDHRRDLRIDRESNKIPYPVKEIKHLLSDYSDLLASSQNIRKLFYVWLPHRNRSQRLVHRKLTNRESAGSKRQVQTVGEQTAKLVQRNRTQQSSTLTRRTKLRISKMHTPRIHLYYRVIKLDTTAKTFEMQMLFIFDHMFHHCDQMIKCNPSSRSLYDYSQVVMMYVFAFIKLWIFAMACKMHCWFTQTLYKAHRKRS